MQDTFDPSIDGTFKGRKPLKLHVKRANRELRESMAELKTAAAASGSTCSTPASEAAGDELSARRKVAWASVHGFQSMKESTSTQVEELQKDSLSS